MRVGFSVNGEYAYVDCVSRIEAEHMPEGELKNTYLDVYNVVDAIAKDLQIAEPCIAIKEEILGDTDGNMYVGYVFPKSMYPDLPCDIINLSICGGMGVMIGALAHEMRHIYQTTHKLDLYSTPAYGSDVLHDPAEIDADGYAIFYLTRCLGCSLTEAIDYVLSFEQDDDLALKERVKRANLIHWERYKNVELQ